MWQKCERTVALPRTFTPIFEWNNSGHKGRLMLTKVRLTSLDWRLLILPVEAFEGDFLLRSFSAISFGASGPRFLVNLLFHLLMIKGIGLPFLINSIQFNLGSTRVGLQN